MSRVVVTPKLESVTVYDDSAQLTFSTDVTVNPQSTTTVVVENVQRWGQVNWSTLQFRLDAATDPSVMTAVRLQNISPVHEVVTEDVRADVQRAKDAIAAIAEEEAMCKEEIDILEESEAQLESIKKFVAANAFATPEHQKQETSSHALDYAKSPSSWVATGAFFARREAETLRKVAARRVELEEIGKRLESARQKLRRLGGESGQRTHTKNMLEATLVTADSLPPSTTLRVELSCVVAGANWSPNYDVRVDYAASMLDVFFYADVQQRTAVDWEKVRLRLSTATPHTGGSPPPLWPRWNVSLQPPRLTPQPYNKNCKRVSGGRGRGGALLFGAAAPAAATMAFDDEAVYDAVAPVQLEAVVEGGGSSSSATVYAIPGLVTVRHTNTPVKVTVAHERFPAKLKFVAIPKVDPLTHLSATAVNASDYEFMSGPSRIFYGNTFVNTAQLNHVSPGEEFGVSLGTDDTVTVDRSRVRRREAEKNAIFSSTKSELEFQYAYKIQCGALATRGPVTVEVRDNYPVSDDADVVITLKEPNTKVARVDAETHEVVWEFAMSSHEKKHFDMLFTATYPEKTPTYGLS